MRRLVQTLGLLAAVLLTAPPPAGAHSTGALRTLRARLSRDMGRIGGASGAYVVDLTKGVVLFSDSGSVRRLPASVQKLYTTTTALERFGPNARLRTSVLGRGWRGARGVWHGALYLRGGGDPTLGWASFVHATYGSTGTTVQMLVSNLIHQAHITAVHGAIIGDESYFDSRRSTAESGFRPDSDMEGQLSALAFDRGFATPGSTDYQSHPALYAAQQFASALRSAGVQMRSTIRIASGRTPRGARLLTIVRSPRVSRLIRLTNTPSDNFMAEMLLKGLGASFGRGGTTASGAAVVRSELSRVFGLSPRFNDGSGLSYADSTSPRQIVTLLRAMAGNRVFRRSLAIGGRTGTLQDSMRGTAAQGHCQGKTGTLHAVANLSGYCQARDGHNLAFAILANSVGSPDYVHSVEANDMAVALAEYDG
ncbi:MAG: D-alanyl-D-alanine carboxypeptidase/D-alanyl-D-alanine-endopeptidase [Solirubrobacteraceae bacterium]